MSTPAPSKPQTAPSPEIESARWRIDPARSNVGFRTATLWGLAPVEGRFDRYAGSLDLGGEPAIELTIEAASLDTDNKFRDKHLKAEEFFDAQNHPEVRFASDTVTLDGELLKVRGRLTAAGSTVPLELEATVRPVGAELEVDARTSVDHRQLGMTHGTLNMIRPPSELIVHGRLVQDAG